jgi:hypothetical protein
MAKKFTWKVWLLPNALTKEIPNDSIADVSTAGDTKHNTDIAKAIKEEGSDLQIETLVDVLNRGDRWKRRFLLEGSSVQDGNVHMAPRVSGSWEGAAPLFDPKRHKLSFDAVLTADLRKTVDEEVGVEVLGKKADGGALISLVTDVTTGKKDGTVTSGGDMIITGVKIRIDPVDGDGLGIFLVNPDGFERDVTRPYTQNDPKKIICRVPSVDSGVFTLKIVTRFSNGKVVLKTPRTITYELPLTVVSP